MPDEFVFKKPLPAVVVDNGSGMMFAPPAIDQFDNPIVSKAGPPVFVDGLFKPAVIVKIDDIPGESFTDEGFVPQGFDDIIG